MAFKLTATAGGSDNVEIFSDSDHAGDRGLSTRSQSGYIMYLNGMPVHWVSRKQPVTSLSSASAEIYALSECAKDAQLMKWRWEEMGMDIDSPLVIQVDNTQAESFQGSTCADSKLRGTYDLREHWVRELQDETKFNAVHISTDKNIADLFTKCLSVQVRDKLEKEIRNIAQDTIGQLVNLKKE